MIRKLFVELLHEMDNIPLTSDDFVFIVVVCDKVREINFNFYDKERTK